ncbi:hypothetical protein FSHL1_002740 [Fusarium sambucinum]
MVGVPGRSKGCVTCRSRKKGCDKKLPNCTQCIAHGVICGGYQRKPVWLNADGARQAIYSKAPGNTTSSEHLHSSEAASNITLHDSLTITARTQKYTGLFWSDYLLGGNGFSIKVSGITSTEWMQLYETISNSEPTLRYTTMALSTAALATNASNEVLHQKSQQAYGLALRQMATSLVSQECNKEGLLAAIQLMRVYEQLFGVDPIAEEFNASASRIRGFVKHVDGEIALVSSSGLSDTWSFTGYQLVLDGRLDLVNTAISRRKASPFSQHQWKTSILWQRARDSPLKRLVDIMVEVPGLLESLDVLRRTSDEEESLMLHSQVVARCEACRTELLAWEMEQGETLRVYDYIVTGELSPPQNDEDLASVYLSCYYWMVSLIVYSTIGFCELEIPSKERGIGFPDCPSQRTAVSYAHRIAHAIHFLFEPPAGKYSCIAAFFPLGNTLRYLLMIESYQARKSMSLELLLLSELYKRPFLQYSIDRFLMNLIPHDGIDYGSKLNSLAGLRGVEYRARVWWCGIEAAGILS